MKLELENKLKNKKLRRSRTDEKIAGVAGGLGKFLNVDPVLIRVGFAGLTLATGGTGLLLYGVLWAIMPPEEESQEPSNLTVTREHDEPVDSI
ncbi:MAG: PspC domain-containing protein [Heteroscytonema crispum UTEX LB 1556]